MNVRDFWISKAQIIVTLVSSEAKYVTISEAIKEFKFMYFLLHDIGIDV
jgi:hypothetical protein